MKFEGGYAIVAHYLMTLEIPPEYGLGWLMGRAPKSSSSAAALQIGVGKIEQELLERIEQGEVGFRNGWASSIFIDRAFIAMGRGGVVPLNKRREMMRVIGYDWHPALVDGRVNNIVMPDGGKPKLFVRAGHPALSLTSPAAVASAYSRDQGVG